MNNPPGLTEAIEAGISASASKYAHGDPDVGMFVVFTASDGYNSVRGATASEVADDAVRAAYEPIARAVEKAVREQIERDIEAWYEDPPPNEIGAANGMGSVGAFWPVLSIVREDLADD